MMNRNTIIENLKLVPVNTIIGKEFEKFGHCENETEWVWDNSIYDATDFELLEMYYKLYSISSNGAAELAQMYVGLKWDIIKTIANGGNIDEIKALVNYDEVIGNGIEE